MESPRDPARESDDANDIALAAFCIAFAQSPPADLPQKLILGMNWYQQHTSRDRTPGSASSSSSEPTSPSLGLPSAYLDPWPASPSTPASNQDVLSSVLKVRKAWKTLRSGETVWPLELEAALIEGLERYQPEDCRETRMLGRFPRRNRFISEYIFGKTGKWRSAKQVGSRLQQLRESCGGDQEHLLHLLFPFRDSDGGAGEMPAPTSSNSHIPSETICIDLVPPGSVYGQQRTASAWADSPDVIRVSDMPRRITSINPLVSFSSPTPIAAHSRFTVYAEDAIVHAETVPLEFLPVHDPRTSAEDEPLFVYTARLIPKYWSSIAQSTDPTRFVISQEVYKEGNSAAVIYAATYNFAYAQPPTTSASVSSEMSAPQLGYGGHAHTGVGSMPDILGRKPHHHNQNQGQRRASTYSNSDNTWAATPHAHSYGHLQI
ncbi:unnamed protein product [Mycena citricolor]|uniref:TEA domain-containing protein n=1 Tax=Mycena citricolor TaxID=2018698 RepID=A0AAD2HUR4_9AGAR|nr:unnamed protein product [Mycena citricolor]CAK5282501.1 unnamed protein product [Mycena citricolor]